MKLFTRLRSLQARLLALLLVMISVVWVSAITSGSSACGWRRVRAWLRLRSGFSPWRTASQPSTANTGRAHNKGCSTPCKTAHKIDWRDLILSPTKTWTSPSLPWAPKTRHAWPSGKRTVAKPRALVDMGASGALLECSVSWSS